MSNKIETINLGEIWNSIIHYFKFYVSNKKIIFFSFLFTILIGIFYYISEKSKYQANATFVLMESGGSKNGSLASLSSQFGFDLGGVAGQNSIFSGDNVFDIFKSRIIIENTLLSNYQDDTAKSIADVYYRIINKRRYLKFLENNTKINFKNYAILTHTREKDSILNIMVDRIISSDLQIDRLNKKSSIIKLSVSSTDEKFAKIFTEKILEIVKDFYTNIKNSNTQLAVNKLQKKADSLQNELNEISNTTFKNTIPSPTNLLNENLVQKLNKEKRYIQFNFDKTVNAETAQRNRTITYTLFAEVIKNLEFTKLTLAQQTPIFQILDTPKFPLTNNKSKISYIILLIVVFGLFISILVSGLKLFLK
jgi:uncharacterized protein involved in exopolysaccharide biosynthesis